MIILSIETSCDETASALAEADENGIKIISDIVSSQIKLHSRWGGVVPNLAAREHLKNIIPVIEECMGKADIGPEKIDLIAVTNGPGLIPALLIGTSTAKTLSYLWKKPLIGIHHVEGHIYANFIEDKIRIKKNISKNIYEKKSEGIENITDSEFDFPMLCLIVSGGHTQLVLVKNHFDYEIIGETLDDAAGEAFDKVSRILNLGYPGGPAISMWADSFESEKKNKELEISFPRPMMNSNDLNFSFSGLKTSVLYLVKKNESLLKDKDFIAEVSHEFQNSVVDVLVQKTLKAAEKYSPKTIVLAGGVSANSELRKQLGEAIKDKFPNVTYRLPEAKYSIDNAAMIAAAAYYRWKYSENKNNFLDNWKNLKTEANLKLQK